MEVDAHIHRRRSIIATIVTLFVLAVLGLFVWRVIYYAEQIRTGTLDTSSLDFSQQYSITESLAANPVQDGVFDVATVDDPFLGSVNAPVTIVEFADFGCPYSRESSFTIRELALKYPDQVRFVYRDFPLTDIHPIAQKAAEAGECAQDQGRFWEFHDRLYQNQATLVESDFVKFAESLNMNVFQFERCLESGRYADEVTDDLTDGIEAGVRGTPTFFVNGNRIAGAIPQDILDAIIQSILTRDDQ